MSLMDDRHFKALECDVEIGDSAASITIQFDSGAYWATATLQDDEEIVALRDWLVAYCEKAKIG